MITSKHKSAPSESESVHSKMFRDSMHRISEQIT